ncbi:MAG: TrkA family potassium uptake protein [Candidatus Omnitrophota bacterium]
MEKEKVFAVFGLGKFGMELCRILSKKGEKVIAIDQDQAHIEKIKDAVTQAILLDSTDESALLNAGLQDVDVAVVAIRESIDASVLTTILLKNLGVPRIIARAISDIHAQVLKQVGAAEVINIEIEEGRRLANRLAAPDIMDIIPIAADQVMAELRTPQKFVGKSIHELDVRKKYNVNIISIKRTKTEIDDMGNPRREELVFSPKPMDVFDVNDTLIVVGTESDIAGLREMIK